MTLAQAGTPATYHLGSDRYPYVVLSSDEHTVTAARALIQDELHVTAQPGARDEIFYLSQLPGEGLCKLKGEGTLELGIAQAYQDPGF